MTPTIVPSMAQRARTPFRRPSLQSSSSTSDFRSLFSQALLDYKRRAGVDLLLHPLASKLKDCDSPDTILRVLEEQTRTLDQPRSSDGTSTQSEWRRSTVYALYHLSMGIEADMLLSPAKVIFVGIGVLLSAVQGVDVSQVAIINTLEKMGGFFGRLAPYTKVPSTTSMEGIMLAVLSILGLVTKEMKRGPIKLYLRKIQGRSEIEDALQTLDKLTQGKEEKTGNPNLPSTSTVSSGDSNAVTQQQHEVQQDAIRSWLSPSDSSRNYNLASTSRHEGTAQWFLKNKTFLEWESTGLFLWVIGKPGSGKSVVSAAIIEHIDAMCKSARASMAYFVFDSRDSRQQSCNQMTTSLLTQLDSQSEPYHDMLFHLYSGHDRGLRRPSSRVITECLKKMLSLPDQRPVYVILDAIDECPNTHGVPTLREETLGLLRELVELHPPNLRLCVTSRPEWDISAVLDPLNHHRLSLQDEPGQREDIVKYITDIIHSDPIIRRWRESDKQLVIDTLSERADGMFRWVYCQVDNLRRIPPSAVRRILNELPETLDETYERILAEINITERQYAHRLFHCLTVAIRPLRVEELAEVLAVDFDDGEAIFKLKTDWRPVDPKQAVLSICSSLVEVVNLNGSEVVQFSHPSVKEFLTSDRLANSWGRLSSFRVNLELAHTILAQACLSVLLQLDAQLDSENLKRSPLVEYAARHWVDHARSDNVASRIQAGTKQLFDPKKPYFANWVKIYDMDKPLGSPMSRPERPNTAPLYYAILCDLPDLADYLIGAYPQDVGVRGGQYTTGIHAALYKGHLSIVRLLIERGADVNSRDDDDLTPLHIVAQGADASATKSGHSPPLFMAPNSARDNSTSTPLHLAVTGTPEIVRLLIEHGANPNALDATHSTPLHLAVVNENFDIIRLLIEHGADVNVPDHKKSTPLHFAVVNGRSDTIELLLQMDAGVDSRDDHSSTPLHLASVTGNLDIVKLLIRHGANPNALNDTHSTPLHLALVNENSDIVRLLIEHDADVNVPDHKKSTPLHFAVVNGSSDIIELLLQMHAGVDSRDDHSSTPLHIASVTGNPEIVKLLINYRADLNVLDVTQSTPLHLALVNENFDIVRLLIKHGADVSVPDHKKLTPLHLAADSGNLEVVTLLLERGADVDARDNKRSTPLHLASRRGSLDFVKLLLARGADPNVQNDKCWTPLHIASQEGPVEVVRCLLDRGANLNIGDGDGRTPLHVASSNKNTKVVALLIERGADPSVPDANNQTPFQLESAVSSPSPRGMTRIWLARSSPRSFGGR